MACPTTVPGYVLVKFRKKICILSSFDTDYYEVRVDLAQILDAQSSSSSSSPNFELHCANLPSVMGTPGGKVFHDYYQAWVLLNDNVPFNIDDLRALAWRIACDFYHYIATSHDYVFNGIVPWGPEGITDLLEYTYTQNLMTTRVTTPPLNTYPEQFAHWDFQTCPTSNAWIYDVQCVNGKIVVTAVRPTFSGDGLDILPSNSSSSKSEAIERRLISVSDPFVIYEGGCCDCPGSSSTSSSSHSFSSSSSSRSSSMSGSSSSPSSSSQTCISPRCVPCCHMPNQWSATVSGVTIGSCLACAGTNGTGTMTYTQGLCSYSADGTTYQVSMSLGTVWNSTAFVPSSGCVARFLYPVGQVFNCCGPNTLNGVTSGSLGANCNGGTMVITPIGACNGAF